MEESTRSFVPLLIVIALAFAVPLILSRFRRLKVPIVVGEIAVGIIVGRSGFGWVAHEDPILTLLAEFGFVFLMFQAGLEIDFSSISVGASDERAEGQWRLGPLSLGILSFLLTLLLSSVVGLTLFWVGLVRNPWMMALILSTTSLGVVMPVLKERGLTGGRFGQAILIASLVADFATMFLITVLVAALSHGITFDILLIGLLFLVFFFLYRLGVFSLSRISAVRRTLQELSRTTARIKIRGAFALLLLFVVLSEILGVEIILGAFMAGAMLSLLSSREDVESIQQMEAVGFGFFIPIFFVMVGANLNLDALFASPQALMLFPELFLAAVLVKLVPSLLFRLNFDWRATLAAGTLLSSRLSLIIAASAIGLEMGIISEAINAEVILVAIVSVTLAPLIFNRIAPSPEMAELKPIVVFGAGEQGIMVAEHLMQHHEEVVLVDDDNDRTSRAHQRPITGLRIIHGCIDPETEEIAAFLDAAEIVVVTYNEVAQNLRICQQVRSRYGIDHVVSLVNDASWLTEFDKLGVTVFNPAMDQPALLSLLARNPGVYDLLVRPHEDKEVLEVVVQNQTYEGRSLGHLPLAGDVLVLAIRRGDEFIVPHGNTRLQLSDRLTLVGSLDHLLPTRDLFSRPAG